MQKRVNKKGAIEFSITTIVVVVLGISMLIMGMVLVRNVMCGALSLTGEVNTKVEAELNKHFSSTESEVICIGAGSDPIKIAPGRENIIYCNIKAKENAQYSITVKDYESRISSLSKTELKKWMTTESWSGNIASGDEIPKKAVRLKIPENAPEGPIGIKLEIKRGGSLISTQDLDFQISRVGFVKTAIC
ncbi:MAG: hypothetical protein AABW65_01875 [Nanoarchaeota archaeon]